MSELEGMIKVVKTILETNDCYIDEDLYHGNSNAEYLPFLVASFIDDDIFPYYIHDRIRLIDNLHPNRYTNLYYDMLGTPRGKPLEERYSNWSKHVLKQCYKDKRYTCTPWRKAKPEDYE